MKNNQSTKTPILTMVSKNRQQIGKRGEDDACSFLIHNGLILIEANFSCFCGEIDLIMQDKDQIVFVEVRRRGRLDYGTGLESVTRQKMIKLTKTATLYLQRRNWLYQVSSRFDIIAIHPNAGTMHFEWVKNAFTVDR